MKKIVKLLPAALALMLVSPAFAATDSAQSELTITVPEFINITKESSVETSTASFDGSYQTITLSPALNANFKVINNLPDRVVYLDGSVQTSGGSAKALYGEDADNMSLVFTNTTRLPDEAAVQNITSASGTAYANNPNAIAFAITPTITPDSSSGATEPTKAFESNHAKYTISNGIFDMGYAIAVNAVANTFSTHDTNGTYKATLTLTTTEP